jgi:hypothetical protein
VGVLFPLVEFCPSFFRTPSRTLSQPTHHAIARGDLQIISAHLLYLLLGIRRCLLAFLSGLLARNYFEEDAYLRGSFPSSGFGLYPGLQLTEASLDAHS